jgi:hypothetical protein
MDDATFWPVRSGNRWGFIDAQGNEAIPLEYGGAVEFGEGIGWTYSARRWSTIAPDRRRLWTIDAEDVPNVGRFSCGLAIVQRGEYFTWRDRFDEFEEFRGYYTFIDKDGRWLGEGIQFAWAGTFHRGFAQAKSQDGEYGWIDTNGTWVSDNAVWDEYAKHGEYRTVPRGDRWVLLDGDGHESAVLPEWVKEASNLREDRAPVRRGEKWGYVDHAGSIAIAPSFNWAGGFRDGRAIVREWHAQFIDAAGNRKSFGQYPVLEPYIGELARACSIDARTGKKKWRWLDREGRLVWPAANASDLDSAAPPFGSQPGYY